MPTILPPTPISPTNISSVDIFQCSTCEKPFKTRKGLNQHNTIIRRYNIFRKDLYKLPKKFINEFKKILVLQIHRQLPCHFTKTGLRAVAVACTESQFFATFGGYIHHYSNKTRVYKCIFRGSNTLTSIFNNINWGTKYYDGNEVTSVVTDIDDVDTEVNPLDKKRKLIHSRRKLRYKRGEVIIEWKPRREKDAKDNKYEGGFLYIHFWIMKSRTI
ncbi:hypothetical protein RhiirA4_476831 [Rhizophagus irregularis]|uniref:C2H2-type domain-containing protein n=1 Tax=Rhizophagus irregularis TaxID=588596 RepID=A0A2I1HC92_9GLOM|nr:hypothetical protein RhiirA4_476831 [Rhizophagus irregularis]